MKHFKIFAKPLVLTALTVLAFLSSTSQVPAQESQEAPSTFLSEFQAIENRVGDRVVELAKAIPANRYSWRPAKEARSVSEVLMHIAGHNFGSAGAVGASMPADLPQDLSKVTEKAKVIALLETSYELVRGASKALAGADVSQPMPGGQGITLRAAMLGFAEHQGEHLGQLIAYARSVGVTPPWSR